ncbi:RYamide receptor-like isoform X2 [Oculina patagonica]
MANSSLLPNEENVTTAVMCIQERTVSLQVVITVMYALIFPIALLGNSLVLYVVFKRQSMRSVLNLLIVNMAIADLLVTVFIMPYSVAYLFVGLEWFSGIIGLILCKTIHFSLTASIAASVITLIVITVDRFVSIVFVWKTCLNLRTSKVSLVVIWLIAIAIMGLHLEVYTVDQAIPGDERYFCYPDWQRMPLDFNKFFAVGMFFMLYAFPLVLMAILYSLIGHKLWKDSFAGNAGSGGDANINSSKKRVIKMLVTVTLAFAVCWFPLHLIHYFIYFDTATFQCMSLYLILLSFWLGHANSAINPVLYVIFNKTFRRAFLQALHIESYSSLNSVARKRSDRRCSTTQTHVKSSFRNGNNNEENTPTSPPPSNVRSQKELYAYGKLVQTHEPSRSKSPKSDGGKKKHLSIIVVIDKMTSV